MKSLLANFKLLMVSFIFTSVTAIGSQALTGGSDSGGSHGGGAMACPSVDSKGIKTITYRLLDFWEAEKGLRPFEKKLTIPQSQLPVATQIGNAIAQMRIINPDYAEQIEDSYREVIKKKKSRKDLSLEAPTDTLQPYVCKDGYRVGVGSYSDVDDELSYDSSILSKMSKTDQAGFWLHEAIYYQMRETLNVKNSVVTRLIVADLFSTEKHEPLIRRRLDKSFVCTRELYKNEMGQRYFYSSKFLLHTDGKMTKIVPVWVGGHPKYFDSYQGRLGPGSETQFFWKESSSVIDYIGSDDGSLNKVREGLIKNHSDTQKTFSGHLTEVLSNSANLLNQTVFIGKSKYFMEKCDPQPSCHFRHSINATAALPYLSKYNDLELGLNFLSLEKGAGMPVYISSNGTVGLVSHFEVLNSNKEATFPFTDFSDVANEAYKAGKDMSGFITNCVPF